MSGQPKYWASYLSGEGDYTAFEPGARVLDVGCGPGWQLQSLREAGCAGVGVDVAWDALREARSQGLQVLRGQAERLPFPAGTFDGLICKVAVPYTDEQRAIAEFARVLRPGGEAVVEYHGLGYSLRYMTGNPPVWQNRVYGARTVANTWLYRVSGGRFHKVLGDALYQSPGRLKRLYGKCGFALDHETRGRSYFGFPVFIRHRLRRR